MASLIPARVSSPAIAGQQIPRKSHKISELKPDQNRQPLIARARRRPITCASPTRKRTSRHASQNGRYSLSRRLRNIVLQVVGLCLLLAFGVILAIENFSYEREFSTEVENLAALIARYSAPALAFDDAQEALEGLRVLGADPRIVKAQLTHLNGRELALYQAANSDQLDSRSLFHLERKIVEQGQHLGVLQLWVDSGGQRKRVLQALLALSVLGLCCAVLAWALSRRLPESITRSVTELVRVFDQISASKNYHQRAPATALIELDPLINGFNLMLEEIGSRDEQLRASREDLELALKGSGEGLWDCELATGRIFCDSRCQEILRLQQSTASNQVRSWLRRIHPDDRHLVMSSLRDHFAVQSESFEVECRLRCGGGGWRWLILHGMCNDPSSPHPRLSGTAMDNDERHKAAEESRLLAAVFQNTQEPVVVVDRELQIQAANHAFLERYSNGQETSGMLLERAFDQAYDVLFFQSIAARLSEHGRWEGEVRLLNLDGGLQTLWLTLGRIAGDDQLNYLGTFSRIDQRQKVEDELRYLANYDTLTNLPNRRMFNDRLEHTFALAQRHKFRFALCFIDLNGFKAINDTFGHAVGDELLRQVASRLQGPLRETDTVARLGGDEFVVLVENCGDRDKVEVVAKRLLAAFSQPYDCGEHRFKTSASIGIACYPEDGATSERMLRHADLAMYQAKHRDKAREYVFFEAGLAQEAEKYSYLKAELAHAIEREQLFITLQPKFSLWELKLQSAEVLLRWTHPELGSVSPVDFIPIAEESGLIVPIGEWVLRQAAAQLQAWQNGPLAHMRLAVNVSAHQFDEFKLPALLRNLREEYQISLENLELELTESLLLESGQSSDLILHALKQEGVRLSIDDFGTGYSSLQYLSHFPVDYLKIDRHFVSQLHESDRYQAIVRAILTMAESLNMEVIAEGIETEQQLHQLRQMGCKYGQGYWCSPALVAGEFETFVAKWQTRDGQLQPPQDHEQVEETS